MVVPGMSDGRAFTSYEMDCVENNRLMRMNKLNPSSYRAYLQTNAIPLMKNTLESQQKSASSELSTIQN
jgi:hypothetical protein